ncbi:MAG: tol-pal system-associated acyl-CoA thioesterase [Chromatocurvus sp.]
MRNGEFSLPLRVYIEDTDAGGIVYYVNYLKYMERARTEFMRSLGFDRSTIFSAERLFVVRDIALVYRAPARLDDELAATVGVTGVRGASLALHQTVRHGDDLLVSGSVTIACVSRKDLRPRRMPGDMLATLRARASLAPTA